MPPLTILQYDARRHLPGLRACVVELQDVERALDPRIPAGADIVDDYLPQMMQRCKDCKGRILIADAEGDVAGYVTILTRVSSGEIAEGDIEYGLVADLVVREKYRGSGLGRRLLNAAEAYARDRQVRWLRVAALAANRSAHALYASSGFAELFIELEKDLAGVK